MLLVVRELGESLADLLNFGVLAHAEEFSPCTLFCVGWIGCVADGKAQQLLLLDGIVFHNNKKGVD